MLENLGADVSGIGDVEQHLPKSLRDMPIAVSFAVRLSHRIMEEICPVDGPQPNILSSLPIS